MEIDILLPFERAVLANLLHSNKKLPNTQEKENLIQIL
jgi:hypothetical protein